MNQLIETFIETGKRYAQSQNFVERDFIATIETCSAETLDNQDFGIIKMDDTGKILFYNRYESELANISKAEAEGKNFFYDIAPCTNNRLFLGTFEKGVNEKEIDVLFFYTFTYRMSPTGVKVHIYRSREKGTNWVFIKKSQGIV